MRRTGVYIRGKGSIGRCSFDEADRLGEPERDPGRSKVGDRELGLQRRRGLERSGDLSFHGQRETHSMIEGLGQDVERGGGHARGHPAGGRGSW